MKQISLLIFLLLLPVAVAEATDVRIEEWRTSVAFDFPKEYLDFNFLLVNNGEDSISGIEFTIDAPYADYIVEKDKYKNVTFKVKSSSKEGKSTFKITFDKPLEKVMSKEIPIKISTEGLTIRSKGGYLTTLKFQEPMAILEDGSATNITVNNGVIKIHIPAGSLPTEYKPIPWREIWQGVSGFEDHFIAIYDSVPITQKIKVRFREDPIVMDIIEVDNEIEKLVNEANLRKDAGEDVEVAETYIDKAKISLGKAIDHLLSEEGKEAEQKLDAAARYINTGKISLGLIAGTPTEEIKEPVETKKGLISKYAIFVIVFFIGFVMIALVRSYAKTLIVPTVLIVMIAFSALITYAGATLYYGQVIDLNAQVYEEELEKVSLEMETQNPLPHASSHENATMIEELIECQECHGEVEGFHTVKKISMFDKIRGKTPRICIVCHDVRVHAIHEDLIDKEKLDCTDCHHYEEGEISIPEKRAGDILGCEKCHYDGSYIEIHITKGEGSCASCHVGSVGRIHQPVITNIEELLAQSGMR